ncbi:hypothetical protein P0136_08065 [Lentisphaerota bacterium ZTH]|nr:hypothetical protein JYG24_00825 [Lentisphaerota bacterium]WET05318.1 hypothetical protein P0136_08065 [Lentisphaerota bacterium ZTH]
MAKNKRENPLEIFLLEFFEKYYYSEKEFKYKLFARLGITLTALSIIFACFLKVYNPMPNKGNCFVVSCFYFFSVFNLIFLGLIAYWFVKIIFIGEYEILSSPEKLKEHVYKLQEHYKDNTRKTKIKFNSDLVDQYVACANDWYDKNIKLAGYTHKITVSLFALLVSTFFTLCFYTINNSFFVNKINTGEELMSQNSKPQSSNPPPKPPPTNRGRFTIDSDNQSK